MTLFSISLVATLLSNDPNEASLPIEQYLQKQSMFAVVRVDQSMIEDRQRRMIDSKLISDPSLVNNECAWEGVACDDYHKVHSITWSQRNVQLCYGIQLYWIPQSLHRVRLEYIVIADILAFQTRYLPRDATFISFLYVNIAGTPDLTTLPSRIEHLTLSHNGFSGTVYLTHLPPTLREIDLRSTFIGAVVVDNGSLSMLFERAQISKKKSNVNIYVNIVAVETSGEEIDDRVLIYHFTKRGNELDQFGRTMEANNETYETIIM